MCNVRAQSAVRLEKGEKGMRRRKRDFCDTVTPSRFVADEWLISTQTDSERCLAGVVWLQTAALVPWVIFLTLSRDSVIKKRETGRGDNAALSHCLTAGCVCLIVANANSAIRCVTAVSSILDQSGDTSPSSGSISNVGDTLLTLLLAPECA